MVRIDRTYPLCLVSTSATVDLNLSTNRNKKGNVPGFNARIRIDRPGSGKDNSAWKLIEGSKHSVRANGSLIVAVVIMSAELIEAMSG
jgi:hypothetical protein